jgi:hypothetical protein
MRAAAGIHSKNAVTVRPLSSTFANAFRAVSKTNLSASAPPLGVSLPATAPRQGRKPGSKNKLSAQAMQILDRLMIDWMKHGATTLKTLRLERPDPVRAAGPGDGFAVDAGRFHGCGRTHNYNCALG